MRLSTKSRYGLRALVYLVRNKGFASLQEISQKEDISYDYLEKIFAKLKKSKLVDVKRGIKGGYSLSRCPDEITIGQVVGVFEDTLAPVMCVAHEKEMKKNCSRKSTCPTRKVWMIMQENLIKSLNLITLASFMDENEKTKKNLS